jgi:hypothetical protein
VWGPVSGVVIPERCPGSKPRSRSDHDHRSSALAASASFSAQLQRFLGPEVHLRLPRSLTTAQPVGSFEMLAGAASSQGPAASITRTSQAFEVRVEPACMLLNAKNKELVLTASALVVCVYLYVLLFEFVIGDLAN